MRCPHVVNYRWSTLFLPCRRCRDQKNGDRIGPIRAWEIGERAACPPRLIRFAGCGYTVVPSHYGSGVESWRLRPSRTGVANSCREILKIASGSIVGGIIPLRSFQCRTCRRIGRRRRIRRLLGRLCSGPKRHVHAGLCFSTIRQDKKGRCSEGRLPLPVPAGGTSWDSGCTADQEPVSHVLGSHFFALPPVRHLRGIG